MAGEEDVRRRLSVLQILQHQDEAFKKSLLWCHFVVPSPLLQLMACVSSVVAQLHRDLEAIDLCQRPDHAALLDGCCCGKGEVYPCRCTAAKIYRVKEAAVAEMRALLSRCPHFVRLRTLEEGAVRWNDNERIVLTDQELDTFYSFSQPNNFIAY
jgi:hypothetical protein